MIPKNNCMSLSLHTLKPSPHSKKDLKRIGRGLGSTGTYSGRGVKGQGARSGVSGLQKLGIRQMMLATPKNRGFKSNRIDAQVVNVGDLSKNFKTGTKITPQILQKKQLIESAKAPVKILAKGAISISVILTDCSV